MSSLLDYVSPAGLPWLLPRLTYAKAIQITMDSSTKDSCATTLLLHEIERLLGSASSNLPRLQVLVSHLLDGQLGLHSLPEIYDTAIKQRNIQAVLLYTGVCASCRSHMKHDHMSCIAVDDAPQALAERNNVCCRL